jgi:hypothetical protein
MKTTTMKAYLDFFHHLLAKGTHFGGHLDGHVVLALVSVITQKSQVSNTHAHTQIKPLKHHNIAPSRQNQKDLELQSNLPFRTPLG